MKADAKLENARTGSDTWHKHRKVGLALFSFFFTIYYLDLCLSLRSNLPHRHLKKKNL